MIVRTLLKRGSDHKNFAEDSIVYQELDNFLYACVFDGCSKGIESHFASTLFTKAFRDSITKLNHVFDNSTASLESQAKMLVFQMGRKVWETKNLLNLNPIELMSTIILCIVDKNTRNCYIVAFGDGYYRVDGVENFIKNTKFANEDSGENKPDYIAYNLENIQNYSDFEFIFSQNPERHQFENVTDISISTDGMNTFAKFKQVDETIDPVEFLVKDDNWMKNDIMLAKKHNVLMSRYGLINTDDLGMIRIKLE